MLTKLPESEKTADPNTTTKSQVTVIDEVSKARLKVILYNGIQNNMCLSHK